MHDRAWQRLEVCSKQIIAGIFARRDFIFCLQQDELSAVEVEGQTQFFAMQGYFITCKFQIVQVEIIFQMYGIEAFLHNRSGYDLELSVYEPTANIAGFLSGYTEPGVKTVLPAKTMAKMDFRLVPDQRPDDILEKLKSHLKAQGFEDVQVKKMGSGDPVVTPIEGKFVQSMLHICRTFTEQEPEITPLVGGTLPLLGAMKNNVGVLGISTSGNPAYYGSGAHAPNEHIRVSDIPRAIQFNVFMFTQLGEI